MNLDRLLETVGDIYDAATDPVRVAGIGARIARQIGSESALVFVARKEDARLVRMLSSTGNFDARARAAYDEHFHDRNEWFLRGARLPSPVAVLGGELIDYEDFERSEFWNDWCRTVGIYHTLGSTAPIGNGMIAAMGIHRPRSEDPFGEEERAFVRLVIPHVARSVLLAEKLETARWQERASGTVLHSIGVGLILVDAEGRVALANAIAERLIERSRWLTASMGRLRAIHPATAEVLATAIGRAAATSAGEGLSPGRVLRLRDPLAEELAVLVTPFRALGFEAAGPLAAILFSDPDDKRPPSAEAIASTLGLTPAEGALVAGLVGGLTLAEYAEKAGVSFHTARAQLRTVFGKTRVTRQAELVASVMSQAITRI